MPHHGGLYNWSRFINPSNFDFRVLITIFTGDKLRVLKSIPSYYAIDTEIECNEENVVRITGQ